jgi:hypothetical protein
VKLSIKYRVLTSACKDKTVSVLLPERVCCERHAVVEVALGGNILEGQALDVAVGITVGEDINALLPHLLLREFTKNQSSISKQLRSNKSGLNWD